MIILFDNKIFKLNIEIIINKNLYEKNIIDEVTFIKTQKILLGRLKELQ